MSNYYQNDDDTDNNILPNVPAMIKLDSGNDDPDPSLLPNRPEPHKRGLDNENN